MRDILQILLDDPLFKIEVKHTIREFKPKEYIFKQGKEHTYLYFIKSGKVKVIIKNMEEDLNNGHSPPQIDLGPEEIFGEFRLFEELPASADVIALQQTELIEIDIPSLQQFLQKHPEIGYKFLLKIHKILIKRLRHANKAIANLYLWGLKTNNLDKYLT